MSDELRYVGSVKDGKLHIINRKEFDADLNGFEGSRVILSLKKYRKSRSNKQNNYYHGVVINCVRDGLVDMGFDRHLLSAENIHEMLKAKFLVNEVANDNGEFISLTRSTTDLTTTDFMEFIDAIHRWAEEFLNITIPLPGEQTEINY